MSRLFYHVMQDNVGNLLFDVSGTMRVAGSGTLATIYGDEELTVILPNPMTNHPSFASFKCFLGAGDYDFYMAKAGYTFETLTGVQGHGTMAQQDASAVAITDGRISIGGHTPTGVLDVQGSVAASDIANWYFGTRSWPVAPSGSQGTQGLRIEATTGAGVASGRFYGINIEDQPAMINVYGVASNISAGTSRLNIYAAGSANNYFAGNVGIANATPSYPLDVTGTTRIRGQLAVQADPVPGSAQQFVVLHNRGASHHALTVQAQGNDSNGFALQCLNTSAAVVGSITYTASATAFNTSSDVRLKHAVQALGNALSTIQALRPVSFKWKADDSDGHGFLANEVQDVIPEAVTGEANAVDETGQIVPQQMDHSKLVPWLVAALQESVAQVQALTARVANLEQQLVGT